MLLSKIIIDGDIYMDIKEVRVDVMVQREDSLDKKIHGENINTIYIYIFSWLISSYSVVVRLVT